MSRINTVSRLLIIILVFLCFTSCFTSSNSNIDTEYNVCDNYYNSNFTFINSIQDSLMFSISNCKIRFENRQITKEQYTNIEEKYIELDSLINIIQKELINTKKFINTKQYKKISKAKIDNNIKLVSILFSEFQDIATK